jgi:tRNA dimethylallyltransferase
MDLVVTTVQRPSNEVTSLARSIATELNISFVPRGKHSLMAIKIDYQVDNLIVVAQKGPLVNTPGGEYFFHLSMADLRIKNIQNGQHDHMVSAMSLKPGMSVLDCTLGLATDSVVASFVVGSTGSVLGLETSPVVAFIAGYGLQHFQSDDDALTEALRRIQVQHTHSYKYLMNLPDKSYDVVFFDPMFRHPIHSSSNVKPLRYLADNSPLTKNTLKEACRVAKQRVVVKESSNSDEFKRLGITTICGGKHSSVHYGVMENILAIIGPTAVGKTKVSIDLAKKLQSEIISGDSMLVYKNMNIGTAKPSMKERSNICHHLIDILEPEADFSVVNFLELASAQITKINAQKKIPVLAGGTGLYVKALLEGYQFNPTPSDEKLRAQLEDLATEHGNQYLHDMLAKTVPSAAARLHPNDLRRVIRALEVYQLSGDTISQNKLTDQPELLYNTVVIGLTMDRDLLYQRINQRVDIMMKQGLVHEVETLLKNGLPIDCQAMQGIGYKEIVRHLQGETDLITAIDQIKQGTRNFAKRQLTWYRKMPYITWFDVNQFTDYDAMLETFYNVIAGKFNLK